ncbi:arginine 2-monooxygenase [Streptomyces parvulus]|uniref:Arginine 2-monooxygenase n=1 Tax=Streptomyces parvulus TaxID=146923 RepID=A0ABV5D8Q0_9ACTN
MFDLLHRCHPDIPSGLSGERLNEDVPHYLRSGLDAGIVVPDADETDVAMIQISTEEP